MRLMCKRAFEKITTIRFQITADWPCTHEGVQNGKTSMRVSLGSSEQRYETHHNISSMFLFFRSRPPVLSAVLSNGFRGENSQGIFEFLFCEVDMAPCYRRMNGSSAEQVFTGFFIRCFFE